MQKPTQDKNLKKYLMKSIQLSFGYVDYEVETQSTIQQLDKLATKILRHLNSLGYVQMPVDKPAIADEPPKSSKSNVGSELNAFWNYLDKEGK